jgi:hypothetical protein
VETRPEGVKVNRARTVIRRFFDDARIQGGLDLIDRCLAMSSSWDSSIFASWTATGSMLESVTCSTATQSAYSSSQSGVICFFAASLEASSIWAARNVAAAGFKPGT